MKHTFEVRILLLVAGTVLISNVALSDETKALPNVLIIGDSISIGYMEPLKELLKDKANAIHNEGNAAHTGKGRQELDKWLGDTKWDVIHFNFGLHDLKYVDEQGKNATSREMGHIQVPVEKYRENLEAIVLRLEKTGARLIFATTTPFPKDVKGAIRDIANVAVYNKAALDVMKEHKVEIDDLHAFVLPQLEKLQHPRDVHFTKDGSKALAEHVAQHIATALKITAPAKL
jgi:lysophospholipase L1-like esterase